MLRVFSCITEQHDYSLVAMAGIVCVIGSWIAVRTLSRARGADGLARGGWLFIAGVAAGSMIWTTHFVGMLAFQPGLQTGFEPAMTLASLAIAIVVSSIGFSIAAFGRYALATELGGVVVGLGIGLMHYTGMAAFAVAGRLEWDSDPVVASVIFGVVLAALALGRVNRPLSRLCPYGGAMLLSLAVMGMHFTGMSAVTIIPDPTVVVSNSMISATPMAVSIIVVTLIVFGTGISSYLIDNRAKSDARDRLRQLVDATVEGILITEDDRVIDANASFEALAGRSRDEILGVDPCVDLFDSHDGIPGGSRLECHLRTAEDGLVPVAVIARELTIGEHRVVYAVRDLRERNASQSKIRFLADHDALTGLPNRSSFDARLKSAIEEAGRAGTVVSVFVFDLDRFKDVNDIHGHVAGDQLIRDVADRLNGCLEEGTFLARMGGDEFAAIHCGSSQRGDLGGLALHFLDAVNAPFQLGNATVQVGLGVGVASYPADGADHEQLLANADMAMQRAKAMTDGSICFFEPRMDAAIRQRRALAHDMVNCVSAGELEIHYQVQNAVATGEITGFEALLRWNHPERGLVAPHEFIPIAEETGLIVEIGEWVLRQACFEAAGWDQPYRIAVNLSPVQFRRDDLPETVHSILLASGLPASRLELEITESTIVEDVDRTLGILRRLKNLGVAIAMDDFGTGYSSLSTLHAFPFDKIKIDRSFVMNMSVNAQSAIIIRTILSLGENLSIPVLAEGVERAEDLAFLKAEGCVEAQGFYFGRPVGVDEIRGLVMANHAPAAKAARVSRLAG